MNCTYCYEKDKKIGSLDVARATKIIQELLQTKTLLGTKVKLHGGEPFLVFDKIRNICESVWAQSYPELYNFHVTTNGTLIHGQVQEWLSEHRTQITPKLSIDGMRFSHELNRPGSFDRIDKAFFLKNWPDIQVNMTVTPSTMPNFSDNVLYLHSQGFRFINVNFALMTKWPDSSLKKIFYYQLRYLVNFYLEHLEIQPINLFRLDIGRTIDENSFYAPCNVGQKTAYDFDSGNYYPCHMFFPSVFNEKDATELDVVDFTDRSSLVSKECSNCPFLNICRTCYAENLLMRGSLAARDMNLCPYQKIVFAALFNFEYVRILNVESPTPSDYRKMLAIQKWQTAVREIEGNACK